MKRRFTILTAAFMLLAFLAIPMGMIGQTNLQFAPDQATTGSTSTSYVGTETTFTTQEVTFVINNWNPSSLQIRGNQTTQSNLQSGANFYLHNTTAMPGNITGITITYTAGAIVNTKTYATTNSSAITNQTISGSIAGTAETNSVSWTFDGTSPFFAIGMEKGGTSGTTKCGTITVTYTTGGSDTPSISANNIEIVFDATSGDIEYTINNPVEGGVLTANTEAEWLTIGTVGEETVAFTCTENDGDIRTANVTLTYTYGDNETVSKDVTVTQAAAPVIYSTIPALFAAATSTETNVLVTFNDWVVSGVSTNGKNAFVTDNNGNGFVIYDNNGGLENTYSAGNILAGTAVPCSLKKYTGFAELVNVNATDLTITTGGTVTIANVDMADLVGVNTGALLHYDNLTCGVSNNKYYLSDGTTNLQVYNALYAFEALEDGKTYNITGVYQQYNNTKEILPRSADDIEEVIIAEPSVTVTPNIINAPAEGADGTLALAYENITEFYSFDFYFCDAEGNELQEDPDWIDAEINPGDDDTYILDYLIEANNGEARTAYMKVYTFDDDEEEVYAIVTVNQEAYVAPVLDYAELPFEFDGGKADIETTDGLTQDGLDSDYSSSPKLKFKTAGTWVILHFNERPGTLTFDIKGNGFSGGTFTVQTSVDGETYTDLQNYTDANFGNTLHSEEFTNLGENVRYIKWIYSNKSNGNVALGNITLAKYVEPVLVASITVNPDEVNVDAEEHDGTLGLTYENLTITEMSDFDIQYYDAEGEETTEPDWIEVLVAEQDPEIGEGYVVSYYMVENEGEARTTYFKVYAMNDEAELIYSNLVTVNQASPVVPPTSGTWVLTSLADLTEDDIFVIVGNNGNTYAMSNDNGLDAAPSAVPVSVVDNTLSGEIAENIQWNISGSATSGYTFYPNGSVTEFLFCNNANNGLRVGGGEEDETSIFNITDDYLYNVGQERYVGIYNNQDWRSYTTINNNIKNQTFSFYKKVVEPATETYTLDITGYEAGSTGGYYLIASPVTVNPANVEGMTTGEYDLYYFNQAEDDEWRNYKQNAFNLEPGKGYLYAKQATTEGEIFHFELTGTPYDGNGTIELNYTEGGDFPGWNLIGNPYNEEAGLNLPFYRMNTEGTEVEPVSQGTVNPMEGVFVIAQTDPETGDIINAQFTAGMGSNSGDEKLVLNVSRNRGNVVDRAIVRFGQGGVLPKFQLNENSTKLYIVEGDNEYAVVRSANEGEMPVNFKASENGNYTLSVNAENVEMEYLHLIDNMTGTDVDLLATPSYSFEARTNDYESRFRLVFSGNTNVGSSTSSETFAFFNGNSWVINNEGEATLQVIDMMGRVLSNEQFNGSYNNSLNLSAGVYVLRLSNGNTVKTQKVVVD